MKRVVCTVVDSAAELHGQPMFFASVGVAIRSFTDEVRRKAEDNGLYQHPEDYTLMYLYDFDDEHGLMSEPEGGRRVLIRGKDCVMEVQ